MWWWCAKNGIDFTGHLMEEPTHSPDTRRRRRAMRSYGNMQMPGIDMLCDGIGAYNGKAGAVCQIHQCSREG